MLFNEKTNKYNNLDYENIDSLVNDNKIFVNNSSENFYNNNLEK